MKKAVLGLVAVGPIVALPPLALGVGERFREHVRRMASQCKKVARHCRQMTAQLEAGGEALR